MPAPDLVPTWLEARAAFDASAMGPAELCAAFVVDRVRRGAGSRWAQGPRRPALQVAEGAPPLVRLLAERELFRQPPAVAEAIVAWHAGRRAVDLLFTIPTPRELLARQARGRRCVSLLERAPPPVKARDEDAELAFAVHDLCHLEKFVDPAHHVAQVGFFAALDRAFEAPGWAELEGGFDALWADERDHVLADMNGSPIFLFLVLKNKIKLAVRRRIGRERGEPGRAGPLDDGEARAYDEAGELLYELLALPPAARRAARELTSRHDAAEPSAVLLAHFQSVGDAARLGP